MHISDTLNLLFFAQVLFTGDVRTANPVRNTGTLPYFEDAP